MQRLRRQTRTALALLVLVIAETADSVWAGETRVAVAANFTEAAAEIGVRFEQTTEHKAVYSFGSTGQLYAQITQGAPFDVFLAADRARPRKAVGEGFAVPGSRFTYAVGRLVLFSKDSTLLEGEATLRQSRFTKLAIANPVTAPYGAAAVEIMKALGVYDSLVMKLVRGNNMAQVYQFVETGNAEIGFVALSQVVKHDEGSRWLVPGNLHAAIRQDAVLLKPGSDNPAARAFVAFLAGPESLAIMARYGYGGDQ